MPESNLIMRPRNQAGDKFLCRKYFLKSTDYPEYSFLNIFLEWNIISKAPSIEPDTEKIYNNGLMVV
jgi:hypothetical protein